MNLKTERKKLNLTQRELAELSNVGINTLLKIEKGNLDSTKVGTLKKIANTFGVQLVDLFFNEEEE